MSDRLGIEQQREMLPSNTKSSRNNKNGASRQEKYQGIDKGALRSTIANPFLAHPNNILAMQRALGNQAVNGIIQAKLSVGSVHNQFEQEADRLAEQVTSGSTLNRQEKLTSTKGISRRAGQAPEPQSPISEDSSFEAKESVERRIKSRQGAGHTLPDDTRRFMESKFGTDLSQVRIHTGHEAGEISQELNAEAFTHGRDIYMAEGRYKPHSQGGQRLLAHEITHVIQQGGTTGTQATPQLVQRVLGAHRTKGDEERRWASPSGPRTEPTSTALLGTHRTQQVGAQAGSRRAQASPLLGVPSISQDPQRYADWLRTHPGLQSEAERQLTGARMQDFHFSEDQMDDLANRHRAERDQELLALGTGKGQPENPHAHDEEGDLASMSEDPRFQARYQVDRQSDHGNWFARKLKRGKELALDRFEEARSYLPGQHSVIPGEDYDQQGETKKEKAKRIAKTVAVKGAKKGITMLPVVGGFIDSGMTIASAVKEGKRQKVAEDVAERASAQRPRDAMATPLAQRMSHGLATGHAIKKVTKGVEGGIGLASSIADAVTGGISKWGSEGAKKGVEKLVSAGLPRLPLLKPDSFLGKKALEKVNEQLSIMGSTFTGAGMGVGLGEMIGNGLSMNDRQLRLRAAGAQSDRERSSALGNLASEDPEYASSMLDHLARGQMSLGRELYTNRRIQEPEGDHTLRPSEVAKLGRQERARLRERERMGASRHWDLEREREQDENQKKAAQAAKKMGPQPIDPNIPQAPPLPPGMLTRPPAGVAGENLLRRLLVSEEEQWYE